MRILLFHEDTRGPGQGGGAESMLRDLTEALKRRGHTVAWLHSEHILKAIDEFKPDIVQVGTIFNRMGWKPLELLQESGMPHVQAIMDYYPFCKSRMLLINWDEPCSAVDGVCNPACDMRSPSHWLQAVNKSPVIALNEYSADIYKRNGMRADYIGELGVDTDLFAPDPTQRQDEIQIYTSSAWAAYPAKGMKYLKAAMEGLPYSVKLMTGLSREQVALGLKQADIYVFPSVYEETWGLCLQEAMASGCAVVAADVAGARAQVHEGMGILVAKRNVDKLKCGIMQLVGDAALRCSMGEKARAHVIAHHGLDSMGKRYEDIYKDVIARYT